MAPTGKKPPEEVAGRNKDRERRSSSQTISLAEEFLDELFQALRLPVLQGDVRDYWSERLGIFAVQQSSRAIRVERTEADALKKEIARLNLHMDEKTRQVMLLRNEAAEANRRADQLLKEMEELRRQGE